MRNGTKTIYCLLTLTITVHNMLTVTLLTILICLILYLIYILIFIFFLFTCICPSLPCQLPHLDTFLNLNLNKKSSSSSDFFSHPLLQDHRISSLLSLLLPSVRPSFMLLSFHPMVWILSVRQTSLCRDQHDAPSLWM